VAVMEFFSPRPAAPDQALLELMAQIGIILGRVSERDRARQKLEATLEKLQASNERLAAVDRLASIGQLAAGVAHDINNPAAFVLMNLEVMREHVASTARALEQMRSQLEPAARAVIDRIADQHELEANLAELQEMIDENRGGMERIRSIVRDLSTFSRIDGAEVAQVRLDELARSAANLVEHEVRKRAQLATDLTEVPSLQADPNKLSELLLGLLRNAYESIEPGASADNEVRLETRVDDDMVVVSVSDTGSGIPAEVQHRIFEPFFTTKERGVGTGLGLSRASEIARQHGGELTCRSEPGQGSHFELRLPVGSGAGATIGGQRGRVLVVDDDLQILKAFRRILSRVHEVTIAGGGQEALELLEAQPGFDVVICDLVMPEIDGPALYQRIIERGLFPAEQVIFCSGASLGDRARAFIEGLSNSLLEKPVTPQRLLEVVDAHIRRSRQP
jgi:signal transduction histidine kinase/CheY-like chemotaxis protein